MSPREIRTNGAGNTCKAMAEVSRASTLAENGFPYSSPHISCDLTKVNSMLKKYIERGNYGKNKEKE